MDITIKVALKHDKEDINFCDENGAPLALICSAKNIAPTDDLLDKKKREEMYLPFIWAACRYYEIREIVRLRIRAEIFGEHNEIEIKRIDPVRHKVLMSESCHNCGHFGDDGCRREKCKWEPRHGFIERTDDEARCSECGWLVCSSASSCPNCMARF